MQTDKISKLQYMAHDEPLCVFRWKYLGNKIEGRYVSLTNLRFEAVLAGNDKCVLVRAAPVMIMSDGRPEVIMQADNLLHISQGTRKNIIIASGSLREGESGYVPKYTGIAALDEASPEQVDAMYELVTTDYFPGIDLKMPELYRCSNNPETIKLAYTNRLYEALHIENNINVDDVKEIFLQNLHYIANRTSTGWVIPYSYVHAGGMVVVDGTGITKAGSIVYRRSYNTYCNCIRNDSWNLPEPL